MLFASAKSMTVSHVTSPLQRAQSGPLVGTRLVEVAGIGPGPFAAMLLSDMGADVVRVDRTDAVGDISPRRTKDLLLRGRRSIAVDLKSAEGLDVLLRLIDNADGVIEGFRPGVMERLGAGPETCLRRNPRLVYGRMTGWGQEGPLASAAGHDLNYIALAGALFHFGREGQPPTPPLNMMGDFGGGGLLLAFGMSCALLCAAQTGVGQVIDAAMVDGAALLMTGIYGLRAAGAFDEDHRGANLLDTGSPFYEVYETADAEWISVGPIEPLFYDDLLRRIGLDPQMLPDRDDPANAPELRERFRAIFRTRTRDDWCEVLEGTDACFAPVLRMSEAVAHPQNVSRKTFVEVDDIAQPAPAPRFSQTPGAVQRPPSVAGQHTDEVLAEWLSESPTAIGSLRAVGAVA